MSAGARRAVLLPLAAALLALGLAGCGKKNTPAPPEDREAEYTYPRQYPAPLPGQVPRAPVVAEEEGLEPPQAQRLSPFPIDYGRRRTRVFGQPRPRRSGVTSGTTSE